MNASSAVAVFVAVMVSSCCGGTVQKGDLLWSDEFNYEGIPNPTTWYAQVVGDGSGNNELEYYTNNTNA